MTNPLIQPFRVPDKLPAEAMKSYSIVAPHSTHHRRATCAEVECEHHVHGFQLFADEATLQGQEMAHYVRHDRTRSHTEARNEHGITVFTFAPGQTGFHKEPHYVRLDKPELFVVRGGDHRGNPRGDVRRHTTPEAWVDDFATHQQTLADRLAQG